MLIGNAMEVTLIYGLKPTWSKFQVLGLGNSPDAPGLQGVAQKRHVISDAPIGQKCSNPGNAYGLSMRDTWCLERATAISRIHL